MGKINIPPRERSRELYAGQGNLFEEAKHPRDEGGQCPSGGGPSATMSDEPFELERTKVKQTPRGEIPPKQTQKNLFNPARQDLPGQQRLFGDETEKATQTDTPEFKNWFGDSKIVDEQGEPLVVYHGTTAGFDEFETKDQFSVGSHFGTKEAANEIFKSTEQGGIGRRIIPVYLQVNAPLELPDLGFWEPRGIVLAAKDAGVARDIEPRSFQGNKFFTPEDVVDSLKRAG